MPKLLENVQNSYLRSEERIIVGMGLQDTIVVDTVDAILIDDFRNVSGGADLRREHYTSSVE